MTTPRRRLGGAFLGVVTLSVGAATAAHVSAVARHLERELDQRAERALDSLQAELDQGSRFLDAELDRLASPRGPVVSARGGTAAERYLSTRRWVDPGRLDHIKVLDAEGTIQSSGHWPATMGLRDGAAPTYGAAAGAGVLLEPTIEGASPSLQRWRPLPGGGQLVVGRDLGAEALRRSLDRTGVDRLDLCPTGGVCVEVERDGVGADLHEASRQVEGAQLRVGLDRGAIASAGRAMLLQALAVALGAALAALLLAGVVARRVVGPIEALAAGARELAGGDLRARVEPPRGAADEVADLVGAFNTMAGDMERARGELVRAERVAAWREIARGLAHELKNPLTPILGAVDVIRRARDLRRDDFDEILDEQVQAVREEVLRLKELSDSFARFARLPDPRPEPLDLAAQVDHALALYAADEALRIERRYAEGLPPALADRTQLQTVLTNLIKNAVEALGGTGRITATVERDGAQLRLWVDDDGPGVDEELRDKLFTPYFTTKGSRGTGLGLALSHRIVAEHGGSIHVEDAPGGGARFVIRWPASDHE